MRIALCQMRVMQGQRAVNWATAEAMLREATAAQTDVVVLPEMWTSGYDFARLEEHAEVLDGPTAQRMAGLARELGVWIIAGSLPVRFADGVRNTSLTFDPEGQLRHVYSKLHLIGLMQEDRYLTCGRDAATFDLSGVPAAVMICYDLRFPELARRYALAGAKLLFVPAQWPQPRAAHWRTLLRARAIEDQMYVIGVNMSGWNENDRFAGGSLVVDPWGEMVVEAGAEPGIVYAEVDPRRVDQVRAQMSVLRDVRPDVYGAPSDAKP
jgi:omega-amidase